MAKPPRIKWNVGAFQQIRRLPSVDSILQDVVDEIQSGAGEGYEGTVTRGRTRSRGSVVTAEAEAIIDNNESQTLLTELSQAGRDLS